MKRFVITDWCHERIRQMFLPDGNTDACGTAFASPSDSPDHEGQGKEKAFFIDATAGTGKDTLFLSELLGENGGEILAMDIQEMALQKTRERLLKNGYTECPGRCSDGKKNVGDMERPGAEHVTGCGKDVPGCPEKAVEQKDEKKNRAVLQDAAGRKRIRLLLRGHEHMDEYVPEGLADLIMFNLGYLPGGDHGLATKPATTLMALTKALRLLKPGGLLSLMIYSGGDSGFEEKKQVLAWLKDLDPQRYMVLVEAFYNRPNHPPLPVFVRKLW